MKRFFVFLFLGPILGVLVWVLVDDVAGRPIYPDLDGIVMVIFFGAVVSFATVLIDGFLSLVLPILFRAPVIAFIGATIAVCLQLAVVRVPSAFPFGRLMEIAFMGAACMLACSLLSSNYSADASRQSRS